MGYEELHGEGFEELRAQTFSGRIRDIHNQKILTFLRFPLDCIETEETKGFDKNKFSLRYLRGNRYHDVDLIGEPLFPEQVIPLHFEGPHNLIFYYDKTPLFTVGYSSQGRDIFVHQIQGISHEKEGEKGQNFHLEKLNWIHLSISMVEELGKIQGKKRILIQPALSNKWITLQHIVDPNDREKLLFRLQRIYDKTAEEMGFSLTHDPVKVWAPRRGRSVPGGFEWRSMRVYEKILKNPPE